MAIWARMPDIIWSNRCEIGWPMLTAAPGMLEMQSRRSAKTSSWDDHGIRNSIGGRLGWLAEWCSTTRLVGLIFCKANFEFGVVHSFSLFVEFCLVLCAEQRKALRETSTMIDSTRPARRWLSASEVPGSNLKLIVAVPSLNGGKNSPPIHGNVKQLSSTSI